MALNSKSTDQQVWDAFDDNAAYEELDSVANAKSFITACLILLRRRPKRVRTDGVSELEFDADSIKDELQQARRWVSARDTTGNRQPVRYLDVSGFRD
tara:strand:- start:1467 stop:1760 length:294 start_codon:yes stop_codon:yes gene_type:complete